MQLRSHVNNILSFFMVIFKHIMYSNLQKSLIIKICKSLKIMMAEGWLRHWTYEMRTIEDC